MTTLLPGACPIPVEGVTVCPPTWADDPSLQGQSSYFGGAAPLPVAVGYVVVIGFGAFFSIFTTLVVYLDKAFSSGPRQISSEEFK